MKPLALSACAAIVLLAVLGISTVATMANGRCMAHDDLLAGLRARYNEVPVAMGLANNGRLVEVLVGPGGSWTIVVTRPDDRACITAGGQKWQWRLPKDEEPES